MRHEVLAENLTLLGEIKRFPGSVLKAFTPPFQRLEEPKTLAAASERRNVSTTWHVSRAGRLGCRGNRASEPFLGEWDQQDQMLQKIQTDEGRIVPSDLAISRTLMS